MQGLATLKVFGQSGRRGDLLAERARSLYRATMKVLAVNIASAGVGTLCMSLGAAVTLCWGAVRVSQGELGIAPLMIVLFLGTEVFRPLRELNQLYHQGLLAMSSAMGMFSVLDDQPDVVDPAGGAPGAGGAPPAPEIRFEDVRFAYGEGKRPGPTGADSPPLPRPALDGVSFHLPAGRTLGLVGPSGAGKTTVVNLLFRFYDPQGGRITLGGRDLRERRPSTPCGRQIAVVAQDTYLFYGTVLDNLRLGQPDATDAELMQRRRAANAHEFIRGLPDGYETLIGERGQKLSGGQRQRLAIARALLRTPPS